jgi:predicted metal-dependent peptidase
MNTETKLEDKNLKIVQIDLALRSTLFFSHIFYSLKIKFKKDIPTARTNGISIEINPDFFNNLTRKERLFLILHEICHIVFNHITRREKRNAIKWNIAGDYAINGYLDEQRFTLIEGALLDEYYTGLSTEDIYKKLPESSVKEIINNGFDEDIIENTCLKDVKKINKVIIEAYSIHKSYSNSDKKLPKEISKIIEKLLNPKLPWQTILQNYASSFSKEDYSMRIPSRRHLVNDLYLSSLRSESVNNIIIAIDCSASITEKEFISFISEINGMRDIVKINKLTVLQFSTEIISKNIFKIDESVRDLKLHKGGGTNISPVLDYSDKINPELLIIFTDLEFAEPDNTQKYPTLWVCINNPNIPHPFGDRIDYTTEEQFN